MLCAYGSILTNPCNMIFKKTTFGKTKLFTMKKVLLFLTVTLFFACSKDEEDSAPKKTPEKQFTIKTGKQNIISQELEREYVLRIPSSYKKENKTPLVFVLHGRTGSGNAAEVNSRLTTLGRTEGFITVYPTALDDLRDKVSTWTSGGNRTVDGKTYDDVQYIKDLIDFFKSNLNIDEKRIYLTGFSNGAFMCYKFAFLEGDLFAAIAPISGLSIALGPDRKPRKGPVPLLHVHGLKDNNVPAVDKINASIFNAQEGVDYYIKNNKASETPEVLVDNANMNSRIWRTEVEDGADVMYIQAKNGVHEWFTTVNSGRFSVISEIWKFFEEHPKKSL